MGDPYTSSEKISEIDTLRKKLQSVMTEKVGIFKDNMGLEEADQVMAGIYDAVITLYNNNKLTLALSELRNMVSIAHLLIKQAKLLKVNKGVFYNQDNVS